MCSAAELHPRRNQAPSLGDTEAGLQREGVVPEGLEPPPPKLAPTAAVGPSQTGLTGVHQLDGVKVAGMDDAQISEMVLRETIQHVAASSDSEECEFADSQHL